MTHDGSVVLPVVIHTTVVVCSRVAQHMALLQCSDKLERVQTWLCNWLLFMSCTSASCYVASIHLGKSS